MASGTILIVDKDPELSRIVGAFLKFNGYRVHASKKGRDAIAKLAMQKYSCVILDPDLGDEKGQDVLIAAKDPSGLNSRTPFVLMTKTQDYRLSNESLTMVKGAIAKPFQLEEFVAAFSEALT